MTIPAFVYILCALTSSVCAALLLNSCRRTGLRLLLWSGACFVCLAAGNIILFIDLIILPQIDLLLCRNIVVLWGLLLLLFGLIWDTEKK
jgi:hypothetical protein